MEICSKYKPWLSNIFTAKGSTRYCGLVARAEVTVSVTPNCLQYCNIFTVYVYTQFTNVAASRIIQAGGPRVGDPKSKPAPG
jgi:hypothetical protein